jgi:hypothetical protein
VLGGGEGGEEYDKDEDEDTTAPLRVVSPRATEEVPVEEKEMEKAGRKGK